MQGFQNDQSTSDIQHLVRNEGSSDVLNSTVYDFLMIDMFSSSHLQPPDSFVLNYGTIIFLLSLLHFLTSLPPLFPEQSQDNTSYNLPILTNV